MYFIETHFQVRQPSDAPALEATLPPSGAGQAEEAPSFTQADTPAAPVNTFASSEQTQQMMWLLPDEPRLRVVRGGLKRDWRSGVPVIAGLGFVGLFIVLLTRWPYHARTMTPAPLSGVTQTTPVKASIAAAPQVPTAYRADYAYRPVTAGGFGRPARPVPGYGSFPSYAARSGAFAQVPPAAPTGGRAAAFHYSY